MLTSRQRAKLRALAHPLKPVFQIGKEGLTGATVTALAEALNTRELVKVKVQRSAPITAREAGEQLVDHIEGLHHVQTIGRTIVLYREHPETPEIRLG